MKGIKLTDIPEEFLNSVTHEILNYSIGMVNVIENESTEDALLIGSGTLINVGGIHGILTAEHVIDALPSHGEIGFIISEKLHKFSLRTQALKKFTIAKAKNPAEGPDIGFLVLPDAILGQIKALKSFYNVEKREGIADNPPNTDLGVWCLCGFPEVLTRHEGPDKGFEKVKGFMGFCGFGGVLHQYTLDNFDYFDFEVLYNENTQTPISFGGVSGGGLWQVIIAQKDNRELIPKEIILSGIPFYETERAEDRRQIKCHGRKSIYQIANEYIRNNCS